MKDRLRDILIGDWHLVVIFLFAIIAGESFVWKALAPTGAAFHEVSFVLLFVLSALAAPLFLAALTLLTCALFLPPFIQITDRMRGLPMKVGEHVRILTGSHRGKTVRIYEVWASRRQIRVELDPEEAKAVRDVYSYSQVRRTHG